MWERDADAVSTGNVYAAPPAKSILDVSKAVYNEKGILYVGTNHMGDLLNFELVGELAELENIHTRCVFINDDWPAIQTILQTGGESQGLLWL